jgi:hypothetical protein
MSEEAIFISQTKLARRWGVSVRTLQRKRKEPRFPRPDLYFGDIPHWRMERIAEFEGTLMRKALGEPATHTNNKTERMGAASEAREEAEAATE